MKNTILHVHMCNYMHTYYIHIHTLCTHNYTCTYYITGTCTCIYNSTCTTGILHVLYYDTVCIINRPQSCVGIMARKFTV